MKNLGRILLLHVFLIGGLFFSAKSNQSTETVIDNLLVEYLKTPIGTDVEKPRFSWQMNSTGNERGYFQTAYQVIVTDNKGERVWDSGRIPGSLSVGVLYDGTPLKQGTRYKWSVNVWDQKGEISSADSWFETGLMNSDPELSAWEGAQWIGGDSDDLVLQSQFLSVFKVSFTLQLDSESKTTKAGFVFGANDSRLLDRNKNLYNIESDVNQSYIKFELDISGIEGSDDGTARLNIFRTGYHPDDSPSKPLYTVEIPQHIINPENKYEAHNVLIESVFGTLTVFIDGTGSDHRLSNTAEPDSGRRGGGGFNLNPVGRGGNYISFPLLADIGFYLSPGEKARFTDVKVINYREPCNILFEEDLSRQVYRGIYLNYLNVPGSGLAVQEGAYIVNGGQQGTFITADPSRNSMPMLRTEFNASDIIVSARLYVTARGIYEVYLNGERIGDDYFNPGLTQYNITHMYQTYDVTDMIVQGGRNALGALLGEGWWSGNITYSGNNWNYFGDRQSLLAKLVLTSADGSRKVITTNDRDWKYFNDGPVVYGSFFQGEYYNALKESAVEGWIKAGYDDSLWKNAVIVPLKGTAFIGGADAGRTGSISYEKLSLIGQIGENPGIVKELTAQSVKEVRKGVFIYDMGQNMVGIPSITLENGTAGKKVTLRYAEVLYPDLEEYGENSGMIMLENIRAALAQDVYVLKEGRNTIQPDFTFHGYRYLEITGIDDPIPVSEVKGLVISSIRELTADYQTSNDKVNRLFRNIVWSLYGNFLSIPTDCPQRNERMGWSGDISVFSRTATYLANVDQFFRRHMVAMRNTQGTNGRYTDVAPLGGGFGGILWGSAGMTIPWEAYLQYGDKTLLEEHYNSMKSYVEYMDSTIDTETGLSSDATLGDWLGPQNNQLGSAFLVTAYHVYDLWIMTRVAEILGKNDDAGKFRKMHDERKSFFNTKFVNADHKTLGIIGGGFGAGRSDDRPPELKIADTQTSYAVGLALGVFNEENLPYAVRNLVEACSRENTDDSGILRSAFSLMTGFIGTAWITPALSDNGQSEYAYRLLQQETYPSWIYPVNQGATTIWERLNSYTVEEGFGGNNSMNSFNHYSFGAVGQWMIAYSLGIHRDEPGFREFILRPEPDPSGRMKWSRGHYDSMYGKITSSWNVENGILTFETTIPANTIATVYLPAASMKSIRESGKKINRAKDVRFIRYENGKALFSVGSGKYSFSSEL